MTLIFLTKGHTRHALSKETGNTACGIPGDEITGLEISPKMLLSPAIQIMKCEDCLEVIDQVEPSTNHSEEP